MRKSEIQAKLVDFLIDEEIVPEDKPTSTDAIELKKLELRDKEKEWEAQLRMKEIKLWEKELAIQLKIKELNLS